MTARRFPVIPTIIVALAVATMIALGLWQLLDRLPKKEAFLAQIERNPARPPVAFPRSPDDRLLFRRSSVDCRDPRDQQLAGAGGAGYRVIVRCAGGVPVQLGTTRDPKDRIAWSGGRIDGYISHAPDSRALITTLFDHRAQEMMLVAAAPPAGLAANRPPDLSAIPNSHLAYAGQWFFFAAIASVIYVLASRRRKAS